MAYGLSDDHVSSIINAIATNRRVAEVILFGSRAKGSYRPGSDIDVALKGSDLTFDDILSLSVALDDLWLPYRFDLVLYHRINEPALREHIDRVGKRLFLRQQTAL